MRFKKRELLAYFTSVILIGFSGCGEQNSEGTVPITIDNDSTYSHTLAIIVTDQDGNTEYHVTTSEIQANTEKTLEEKIALPDSVPKDVYVRVLLDTGEYLEFTSTLDTGEKILIGVSESDELNN